MQNFFINQKEQIILNKVPKIASVIFAAGKGSRMKGYEGNKTLLPLIAGKSPFEGSHPILLRIIENLPAGPKAIVVNHKKEDVMEITSGLDLTYCEQPQLNGTGGALLAAGGFLEENLFDRLLITMGDVPMVRASTFEDLIKVLDHNQMAVLGFRPRDKKKYGVLEITDGRVNKITEWKYWIEYPKDKQYALDICNSGIYAVSRDALLRYLKILGRNPHRVIKEREGRMVEVEEYFITDLVELMNNDGLSVGYSLAEDENEVMGIDDLQALEKAREIYSNLRGYYPEPV
jgi:bifunctional UDP-N-acetylglucosamine pyrophosphorylase / glucosamine-1-phosphate N-acetyltransferase